eukprot:TRINITY_DN5195_c0_g1_i4.p4 TRINITY_DN5195_c0_g1~~TRINITY_DN5195_c0_g1_i4.p4  ORF type:complete len:136 (-),score=36.98 TRINITY_DN5195_c0_g1_i4:193-600(-)
MQESVQAELASSESSSDDDTTEHNSSSDGKKFKDDDQSSMTGDKRIIKPMPSQYDKDSLLNKQEIYNIMEIPNPNLEQDDQQDDLKQQYLAPSKNSEQIAQTTGQKMLEAADLLSQMKKGASLMNKSENPKKSNQ